MFSRRGAARSLLVPFLLVASALGALSERAEDTNRDGIPDTWIEEEDGSVVSLATDRNFDGTADSRTRYDADGRLQLQELDFDFDGQMDDFYHYEEGVLTRQEIDSNFDGAVDLWVYLADGLYIAGYQQDTDFDGIPDRERDFGGSAGVARQARGAANAAN